MAKIFMSTLGAKEYERCCYRLKSDVSKVVSFVQEALVSFLCKDWTSEDKIVVFCTEEARTKNWEDNNKEGLKICLEKWFLFLVVKAKKK